MCATTGAARLNRVIASRHTVALLVTAAALFAAVVMVFTLTGRAEPPRTPAEVTIGESFTPTSTTGSPSTTAVPPPPEPPTTTAVPPPPPVDDDPDDDPDGGDDDDG